MLASLPLALVLALVTEAVDVLRNLRRHAGSWSMALEQAWGERA